MLSNEQGASRFKVYFWVALLFLAVHVLLKLVPMYMDYFSLADEMKSKAGAGQVLKDEEILYELEKIAKEGELPLTRDSFIISRSEDGHITNIVTKGGWDVEVNFLFGAYIREFHFEPTAVE
ncbi:MAG: hypothetical protein A2010_11315 [Nitrospirae bacterium GWD2_57_9]|nr:MAG: hypothetical protein A2010_11315 [Nitrospirae bacterium GWD2_57_9]